MQNPDPPPAPRVKPVSWPVRAGFIVLLVLLALGLGVGLAQTFGIQLLPSETWYARVRPYAIGLGLAQGAIMATFAWLGMRAQGAAQGVRKWLVLPFSFILCYWLGLELVYMGPAFLGAAGQKVVTHSYTVREVLRGADRRCPNGVRLVGVPPNADRVCGVPREMHEWLFSGMRLEITGTGNALGLRPGKIRVAP